MSSVLLLQLAGPLQAWGSAARFARRTTEAAPTKSGVVGLLAAALGRDRRDDPSDLAALRFGVRVDQPGVLLRDYQTARHFESGEPMPVSERFYLADAVFVAGVEGDPAMIDAVHGALRAPGFLPYLGRRSCPPARKLDLGVRHETTLEAALAEEPWRASRDRQRRDGRPDVELETLVETVRGQSGDSLRDQPLSFDPRHRQYRLRDVRTDRVTVRNPGARIPEHDPMAALGGA